MGNGVKSFGNIQDKYVHLAAFVHHFSPIMARQYELSLTGASFTKAMLCICQYPMFIKMVQKLITMIQIFNYRCYVGF